MSEGGKYGDWPEWNSVSEGGKDGGWPEWNSVSEGGKEERFRERMHMKKLYFSE